MKTNELTGADLNRAVALALGHKLTTIPLMDDSPSGLTITWVIRDEQGKRCIPNFAGDIAVAWPIITANKMDLEHQKNGIWEGWTVCMNRYCGDLERYFEFTDDDPIVAAMRCFVASKFGDDVNLENP